MELSEIRNLLEGYAEKINGFRESLDLERLEEEKRRITVEGGSRF